MYIRKRFSLLELVIWTRNESFIFLLIALVPTILYEVFGMKWLQLPWLPIALIGTAVAFIIGFQNSAAYDRLWEARKIWGGMVNASRFWGVMIKDTITNEYAQEPASDDELKKLKKKFIKQHIAWLTAMRHAMRQGRQWEVLNELQTNREWSSKINIPERRSTLEEDLKPLLASEDYDYVLQKTNKATSILSLQSRDLRKAKERGLIWEFSFLELENSIKEFYALQGKSERIKNFPYPRQYATLNNLFVLIFLMFLPFGVIPEFARIGQGLTDNFPTIGGYFAWLSVPFIMMVSWVFHTMERIGRTSENPFEGSANDVPISTIARGIEIDLLEMIDEEKSNIPEPLEVLHNTQM